MLKKVFEKLSANASIVRADGFPQREQFNEEVRMPAQSVFNTVLDNILSISILYLLIPFIQSTILLFDNSTIGSEKEVRGVEVLNVISSIVGVAVTAICRASQEYSCMTIYGVLLLLAGAVFSTWKWKENYLWVRSKIIQMRRKLKWFSRKL